MRPTHCGELEFSDLMLPPELAASLEPVLERLSPALLRGALPPRPRSAHKGDGGRVLLVGGGPGMSGAIRLAAEAALRVGAGLVHVATHRDSVATVMNGRPELMCTPWTPAAISSRCSRRPTASCSARSRPTDWARHL
jgi:ADP-dependent NAD(P)H-hydrate dehydratase / NAD(P)H-hydrate epimerase